MDNPFNSQFGAGHPQPVLQPLAGRPAGMGIGRAGRRANGGGSAVVWTSSLNSPSTSGPLWSCDNGAGQSVYDSVASSVVTSTSDDLLYAEFECVSAVLDDANDDTSMGWRESTKLDLTTISGLIVLWDEGTSRWTVNRSPSSASTRQATTVITPPTVGTRIGIALDLLTNHIWFNTDGTWQIDSGGVGLGGGTPGVNPGWTIATSAAASYLWMNSFDAGGSWKAVIPQYLPDGFTSVT